MTIIYRKREVHLVNPSLEELVDAVCKIRANPDLDEFKILIDGTDENADSEREVYLP